MQNQTPRLYEELGELARFVKTAMTTISDASPQIMSSTTQLPTAAAHLNDLSKLTEDGTLEVMRLTELMQDNHGRITKEISGVIEVLRAIDCVTLTERLERVHSMLGQDDKHMTEIMTTLSFQDLVAQRVKKLVTIIDDVQGKLMKLIVTFGLQHNGNDLSHSGTADELLKQLEESKTTAMKQKVADDILAQFGFK